MEALEKTYKDISTMRMKYDHLCALCDILLKNWPHRDNTGKMLKNDEQYSKTGGMKQEQEPKYQSLVDEVAVVDKAMEEMKLLEDILQKAKKVRTSPQHKAKNAALKSKSSSMLSRSQLAAKKVYNQPVSKATKPTTRPSSNSKSGLKGSNVQQRKKLSSTGKVAIKSTKHVTAATENFVVNERDETGSASAKVHSSNDTYKRGGILDRRDEHKWVESDSEETSTFNIQQNGDKLSMPSRYYRIQHALSKLTEEELRQQFSSFGGKHFCKRLVSQGDHGSLPALHKMLVAEELHWLKEKLLSLTPHELTVTERSSWEEVWQIKTKLEALTEHAHKVRDDQLCTRREAASAEKESGKGLEHPKLIAYSSLEEWQSVATLEQELTLSRMESELLQYVNQKLLPLLPMANCPTHLMQTVYELVGLTKPIYVKVGDNQ